HWIQSNADSLRVDGSKIAVLGRSAGGHLALLLAGVEPGVAAAVGVFPPTVFFTGEQRSRGATPARALMGDAATDEEARRASPLTYVGPSYPPTFLLHGTDDEVVPPSASMVMYE